MNRRRFLLTTGATILSGTTLSSVQKPAFALEFEVESIPSQKPENIESITVDFSKFKITPQYVNFSKNATIDIRINIGNNSNTVTKDISINDKEPITKSDLSPKIPVLIDDIDVTKSSIDGEISITITHDSIGAQEYNKKFIIENNPEINGLVAYYPVEQTQSEIIRDATQNNIGQLSGASLNNNSRIGSKCLKFNGSSDYVEVDSPKLDISDKNAFTITGWMKPFEILDDNRQWIVTNDNIFMSYLDMTNSNLRFRIKTSSGQKTFNPSLKIKTDEWQHVALQYDKRESSEIRIFLNGNLEFETDYSGTLSPINSLWLGADVPSEYDHYDGLLDDIRIYNRYLSQSEINDIYNVTETTGTQVTESDVPNNDNGGISRYKLNGDADDDWNTKDGNDTTGTGYEGGVYNKSKVFDGTNGYIKISGDESLELTNVTISLWAHRDGTKQKEYLYDGQDHNYGLKLKDETSRPEFFIKADSYYQVTLDDPIPDKKWVHIVCTYDEDEAKIYINSSLRRANTNTSGPLQTSSGTSRIGDYTGDGYKFRGKIDDLRIYDRALSSDEVEKLFKLGSYQVKN